MHSNIIQLEAFPIEECDLITPEDYIGDHWFVYGVADCVAEDSDHDKTIQNFINFFKPEGKLVECFEDDAGKGIIFHEGFHAAYFGRRFTVLQEALKLLNETASAESFCAGELDDAMLQLNDAYDSRHGIYIQSWDTELVTLHKFLRYAKPEIPYYFGGTVDYHA